MKNNKFLILLIIIALISGFFWSANYGLFDEAGTVNSTRHDEMAQLIVEKGFFNNENIMDKHIDQPIYSSFLAIIYKIFGHDYQVVKIIQLLLFVLLAVLVYRLSQRIFNEKVARLAGLMIALSYSIACYTGRLYRDFFFCFIVFLMIYFLYQAQLKFKNIWFIIAGLVAGLAFLTSGILQFFPILIIINFIIVNRVKGFKKLYPKLAMFFIAFSLVLAPWFISDYSNFGRLPIGGENFFLIQRVEKMKAMEGKYLQHLVGNSLGDFFAAKWFPDYDPREARLGWETYTEWEQARAESGEDMLYYEQRHIQQAKEEILKKPLLFLKVSFIDFLKFNTPMVPNIRMQHMFVGTHPQLSDFIKGSIILLIRFVYLIFFALVIYAVFKSIKQWSKISWLVLIILYFNFIYSNLHALARHSLTIYPFYIILASLGLIILWDYVRNKWI